MPDVILGLAASAIETVANTAPGRTASKSGNTSARALAAP